MIMWPFDEIIDAVNGIYEALIGVVYMLAYPVLCGVSVVCEVITLAIGKMALLLNNMMSIPTMLIDMIEGVFVNVLPVAILVLISGLIFIVLALRVYHFIKDIEILGFKI